MERETLNWEIWLEPIKGFLSNAYNTIQNVSGERHDLRRQKAWWQQNY